VYLVTERLGLPEEAPFARWQAVKNFIELGKVLRHCSPSDDENCTRAKGRRTLCGVLVNQPIDLTFPGFAVESYIREEKAVEAGNGKRQTSSMRWVKAVETRTTRGQIQKQWIGR